MMSSAFVRDALNKLLAQIIDKFGMPISRIMALIAGRPAILNLAIRVISKFPSLRDHLDQIYAKHQAAAGIFATNYDLQFISSDFEDTNRVAKEIFVDLKMRLK